MIAETTIAENGRTKTKGSKLKPYRIKDTGETVYIKKISPLVARDVRKAYPPPEAPINEIKDETGAVIMRERNEADPDYLSALQAYQTEIEEKILEAVIRLGVHVEMDEEKKAEVEEFRATMSLLRIELPYDDEFVWLTRIAVGSQEDLSELAEVIFRRAGPTEAATQEAARNFRS